MLHWLILILIPMGVALWAQARMKRTYARYSGMEAASGATGAEVADAILQRAGIHDVEIVEINEPLGDHYDPMNKRLVLSSQVFRGRSVAALGIAAHECGHAIQHQIAYAPLHLRTLAVGAVQFVNPIIALVPLLWIFLHLNPYFVFMLMAIACGVVMLFNLVTLPVEFDASSRAKRILQGMNFIGTPEEISGVRQTLDAAGLTYVGAFVVTFGQFLFYLLPLLGGGRRDD
jgi:hypothetical protein